MMKLMWSNLGGEVPTKVCNFLKTLLSHKSLPFLLAGTAVFLIWPSVHLGWFTDDIWHRFAYIDTPTANEYLPQADRFGGIMRMYSFWDGDGKRNRQYIDKGIYPWWLNEKILANLWRPLTAGLNWLDYQLWPHSSERMHIHSFVWFTALVIIAALVYREIMGAGWAAGLAAMLYALDHVNAIPVSVLSNRHTLLGAVFCVLALWGHDRWIKQQRAVWYVLALVALLLSLLSSESGVVTAAYLISYSLFLDRRTIKNRIVTLIPYLVLIGIWRMVYTHLGYGISGVDIYVDPAREPLQFLYAVLQRTPILLWGVLAFPPPDIFIFLSPSALWVYAFLALLSVVGVGWLLFPLWKNCRVSHFWLLGTYLSVIPLCAAPPGARNMALSAFGMMGFLAQMVRNYGKMSSISEYACVRKISIRILLFTLVGLSLICGAFAINQHTKILKWLQLGVDRMSEVTLPDAKVIQHDIIFVNPLQPFMLGYFIPQRLIHNQTVPNHIRALASGYDPVEIARIDDKTLKVKPKYGYVCPLDSRLVENRSNLSHISIRNAVLNMGRLGWDSKNPMPLGHQVHLPGMTITITKLTPENTPAEATFVFAVPLEDSSLTWLQWNKTQWEYEEFQLPHIGETVTLN